MSVFDGLHTASFDRRYMSHLIAYLRLKGWDQREYPRWTEFYGEEDEDGEPLMLVLPRNPNSPETQDYMDKAVELLSALYNEPEIAIAWRVQHFHSDVLVVRNVDTGAWSSIPLKVAEQQVSGMKNLVQWSIQSESEPRPYFYGPTSRGRRLVDQFRFGHTFPGSFSLTLEAPILHSIELFVSHNSGPDQPPLLPDVGAYIVTEPVQRAPIERRVIERIMRGLMITNHAVAESSLDVIISEYGSGFNGNMCTSFARLANNTGPVEYGVLWSPKLPVADDLQGQLSIRLSDIGYTMLREAAEEMKRRQPEEKRIVGIVTHFGSNVPPLSEGGDGRQVIIRWMQEDTNRVISLLVPLNKEQYVVASEAHLRWAYVEVWGIVVRTGPNYRLLDAKSMRILDEDSDAETT